MSEDLGFGYEIYYDKLQTELWFIAEPYDIIQLSPNVEGLGNEFYGVVERSGPCYRCETYIAGKRITCPGELRFNELDWKKSYTKCILSNIALNCRDDNEIPKWIIAVYKNIHKNPVVFTTKKEGSFSVEIKTLRARLNIYKPIPDELFTIF
jgi:hypothetical protein